MAEEHIERHEVVIDSEDGVSESHTHEVVEKEDVPEEPGTTTVVERETIIEEEEF